MANHSDGVTYLVEGRWRESFAELLEELLSRLRIGIPGGGLLISSGCTYTQGMIWRGCSVQMGRKLSVIQDV